MDKNRELESKRLIDLGLSELADELGLTLFADRFLTNDHLMLEMKERVKLLAPSMLSLLILGESGVGKELIANSIHENSGVKGRFVGVNCAGIPSELLESEFFGSKKGAYTGSIVDRIGLIQEAHEGTLFLDEIGDMPLMLQCKLLRCLEDRVYRRLGDNKEYPITCRIVSATNYTVESIMTKIRADLYYRLAGGLIVITPLRSRRKDITLICNKHGLSGIPDEWFNYDWPGNVRELINKITEYKLLNNIV